MLADADTGRVVVPFLEITETVGEATVGLLGRARVDDGGGLLIRECRFIHMFFMAFPIDAVFLDSGLRICKIVEKLKPWRLAGAFAADSVLEMPAGAAAAAGLKTGMTLSLQARADLTGKA